VDGRYAPGQRLIEQRLAEEFELSRTPLREALRLLQSEGLVDIEANRGARVRPLTIAGVVDLYELRSRLEAYAAERAAQFASPDVMQRLDHAVETFDHVATDATPDLVATSRANSLFHSTIVEAANHARLANMLARTVDHPLVFQAFATFDAQRFAASALFHRLIRDAIAAGDGRRAGALLEEHVLQGRDALLRRLASGDEEPVLESGAAVGEAS
jgi:DNA-binding GntR family transcriptional regulator